MKPHHAIGSILFLCCMFFSSPAAIGANKAEVIQQTARGAINWTQGIVSCDGIAVPPDNDNDPEAIANARQHAARNLMETVESILITKQITVGDVMAADAAITEKMRQIAAQAEIVKKTVSKQKLRVTANLSLYGGFAQLFLPQTIQQIESIKAVAAKSPNPLPASTPDPSSISLAPEQFSGLIVDARGLGLQPSLAPCIYDENGRQVYGPAFISREFAVTHGVCGYAGSIEQAQADKRVVYHPLMVKGLRITEDATDVIISNMDASKIRGKSENLALLKACRVIVVLD